MPLNIASLNSGSNGNCYYVGNESEAILVDAGISCRETEKRLAGLGLSFGLIRAIFISHEHSDHIRGVEVIAKKHRLPVYITGPTLQNSRLKLDESLVVNFIAGFPVHIGSLEINASPKKHDAADPHSFTITDGGITIGVFTDIGEPCEEVICHFRQCRAVFLEANYDEKMLEEGSYPWFLKNRIRGDHGHLSNQQALDLFARHKPPFMTHLLLSHLSHDNNNPEMVSELFKKQADGIEITVASRYGATEVYQVW